MPAKKTNLVRSAVPDAFLATDAVLPESVAQLARTAPSATPSPAVKLQLLARIRAAKTPAVGSPAAATLEPGWRFESVHDATGWFTLPFSGVRMKKLSADPKRDVIQLLIEIAPGARFPDHDHSAGDEGIVLSGDVLTGGRLMRAGDYYHAGPGTKHTDILSPSGCTALVSTTLTAFNRWREELAAGSKQ
jgi:ChrR Cupin-like domain